MAPVSNNIGVSWVIVRAARDADDTEAMEAADTEETEALDWVAANDMDYLECCDSMDSTKAMV